MIRKLFFYFLPYVFAHAVFAQQVKGIIKDARSGEGLAWVNIGIVGKNRGTVSNEQGHFTLQTDSVMDSDRLRISMIGYQSMEMSFGKFLSTYPNGLVLLSESAVQLKPVVIKPRKLREKILGNTTRNSNVSAGFKQNKLGYELGVLMKNKRYAYLHEISINIANCSYDSIFYRVNIYRRTESKEFEPVLTEPIYLKLHKSELKESIIIPLKARAIEVEGDFLVSLELIKDLGEGHLYFCAGFMNASSYYRETSQGDWKKAPVGVSISVKAEVE